MKKILILLVLLFILCGCTAEVNINIDNDVVKEEVSINYFEDSNTTKASILSSFRKYVPAYNGVVVADTEPDEMVSGVSYYNREVKDLGSGYNFKYTFNYPINSYVNARTFKRAFQSGNVTKNKKDKIITISTATNGMILFDQYDNLSSVVVNIKTNNEVIETNGTLNNGVYTWKFDRNNKNKNIYMKLKVKDEEVSVNNENKNSNTKEKKEDNFIVKLINKNPLLSVLIIVGVFIIFLLIFSKISRKKYE